MQRPLVALKVGTRRVAGPMPKYCRPDRRYGSEVWRGLMVDNGANTDVVGLAQLRALEKHTGLAIPFRGQTAKIQNAGGAQSSSVKLLVVFLCTLIDLLEKFPSKF
eukprot:Plantae.Rhodophyta-Palmaria_palmata.ctg3528.p2 GENE.Plantae.Rhodophyta-Palmaria_palmata.ctg3528~~Plantae.Rhodophyta-Palmaria_palmata.ctg3528.p2  ORF type:complete len:106 (-),score=14.91 Plantae.Rhodophyta-Palmaria_palmata.ctg3528:734-1051(-)